VKRKLAIVAALLLGFGTARADEWTKVFEVGAAYGTYSDGYGNSDFEFARFVLSKPNFNIIRVEVTHAGRFGDSGFGYGAWYTQFLPGGWQVMGGGWAGTGDFIYPEHQWDFSVGKSMLEKRNLFVSVFYSDNQSKQINSFTRLGVYAEYRPDDHWILSANVRNEHGQPGSTDAPAGGVDAIWGEYRKYYFGAGIDYGDISYQIISADTPALVDYHRTEIHGTVQWYVGDTHGWNAKVSFEHNDIYDLGMVMGSYFWEW
jgi:YaiO family outer membrane protein